MVPNHLIDIVMCTYNGERFIAKQLDSILKQTFQDFHLTVFDDNSSDNTLKIVDEFARNSKKITSVRRHKRLGFVRNFELGIESSLAPFISLADQDDIWLPQKLELQIKAIQEVDHKNIPVVVNSDLAVIDSCDQVICSSYFKLRKYKMPKRKYLHRIITYNGVMGCSMLFNQQLKRAALPFPIETHLHDYWLALLAECTGIRITINKPLILYRRHSTNYGCGSANKKVNARPYQYLNRTEIMRTLLEMPQISSKDKKLIYAFNSYLNASDTCAMQLYFLLRYRFIKFGPKFWRAFVAISTSSL